MWCIRAQETCFKSTQQSSHGGPAECSGYALFFVALVNNAGKIMARQMLLSQVWGTRYGADAHYLHVYVGQLRHKIEPDPAHPRFILTISGIGYRFSSDDG